MAIAVASTASTGYATASSITITKPSGLAAGDLLVCLINIFGNGTVTTPSGWTQGTQQANGTTQSLQYLYKIADSADAAASNFTFNLSGSLDTAGGLLRVTGSAGSSILAALDQDTITGVDISPSFTGGLTPTNAGSLLVMAFSSNADQQNGDYGSFAVVTDNPTWTQAWEIEKNLTDNNNYVTVCAYAVRTETSATGNYSASGGGYAANGYNGFLLCFNPSIAVTVSPAVIQISAAVQTSTITGGSIVSPAVISIASSVPSTVAKQANWSAQTKSDTATWSTQTKS